MRQEDKWIDWEESWSIVNWRIHNNKKYGENKPSKWDLSSKNLNNNVLEGGIVTIRGMIIRIDLIIITMIDNKSKSNNDIYVCD